MIFRELVIFFIQKFAGTGYSFGYPDCTNREDQAKVFLLLELVSRALQGESSMRSTVLRPMASRTGVRQPAGRAFERELAELESMSGHVPTPDGVGRIRKALGNENNYLVSKAARLAAEYTLTELLPQVLSAFERFFEDPIKSDPQCWAKAALAKALVKLECRDADIYLRGLRHRQEEPVWGGQSDTAGGLRGTCTLALVGCDGLSNARLLELLLDPLVDSDKTVRMEAARAIGHAGGASASLLLKLRILAGKEEPEVMGSCFSALLGMDGERTTAISLVAGLMDEEDEVAGEAALALAETHDQAALAALIARRRRGTKSWLGSVLDQAIALTRLPESFDFLINIIEREPRNAESALEAISHVPISPEVRARVERAVERLQSERISQAYRRFFPEMGGGC